MAYKIENWLKLTYFLVVVISIILFVSIFALSEDKEVTKEKEVPCYDKNGNEIKGVNCENNETNTIYYCDYFESECGGWLAICFFVYLIFSFLWIESFIKDNTTDFIGGVRE